MNDSIIEFHRDAEREMLQAAEFYKAQEPGLEQRFLDEIDKVLLAISNNPKSYPVVLGSVRKKTVGRFPYTVLYRKEASIYILAVMHQRREPNYWENRL